MFKNRFDLRKVAAIAACLAVTIGFASCEKDDLNTDTVDVKLLDTETSGLFHSRKFVYDEQNRMKEIGRYWVGGILGSKVSITYAGEDLTKFEYTYFDGDGEVRDVYIRNFIKNGNTISWSEGVFIVEVEGEGPISTITLNNDGFPEKLEEELYNYTWVSTFTFLNGNLTNYVYDYSSVINDPGERNYTYNAKRSAFSGCNTPKWFLFLQFREMASHNAVTSSSFSTGMPFYSCSYEFDRDGFPKKIFFGSKAEDITEYTYKNQGYE